MPDTRPLLGDSGRLVLDASLAVKTLKDYQKATEGQGVTRTFSVYSPDGSDPNGDPANTDTIFCGPNRSCDWPLAPGAWKDFDDVDPALMSFRTAKGTANQIIRFAYGGTPTGG